MKKILNFFAKRRLKNLIIFVYDFANDFTINLILMTIETKTFFDILTITSAIVLIDNLTNNFRNDLNLNIININEIFSTISIIRTKNFLRVEMRKTY